VKESSFYVELLEVPVEVSCEVEDDAEGLYSGRGCGGFVVIDAELLSIAFCDIPEFVTGDVASVISFPPADKFSPHLDPGQRIKRVLDIRQREAKTGRIISFMTIYW
jgi:hypothetical protein